MKSKRIITLLLVAAMLVSVLALSASAKVNNDSSSVQRVPICPRCGERLYIRTESQASAWVAVSEYVCTHHIYGSDIQYERMVVTRGYCRNCDFLAVLPKTTTETKVVCNGYD